MALVLNAENAADNLLPLEFTEANELFRIELARRGLSDDLIVLYGENSNLGQQ
jgi:hypothetical protein